MFDLSNLTNLRSYDHLHSWEVYRLAETMATVDRRSVPAGTELTYDHGSLNLASGDTTVYFHDPQGAEYAFATHRSRIGLFERMGRETRPLASQIASKFKAPPPADPSGWLAWLRDTAGMEDEAKIMAGQDLRDPRTAADALMPAARMIYREFPEIGRWLAARADSLYGSYMSGATSGGEGRALYESVRNQLDDIRAMFGKPPGRDPIPWPPGSAVRVERDFRKTRPPGDPAGWPAWLTDIADMAPIAAIMAVRQSADARAGADALLQAARTMAPHHPEIARWLADRARSYYAQAAGACEQVRDELDELERILKR